MNYSSIHKIEKRAQIINGRHYHIIYVVVHRVIFKIKLLRRALFLKNGVAPNHQKASQGGR